MSIGWSFLTDEGEEYFNELEKLSKLEVVVGFQSGDLNDEGESLAEIAMSNEEGSSTVPPRPFMRQSFEGHESELQEACEQVQNEINEGRSDAEGALEIVGVVAKGLVQDEIVNGDFAPNSPATIARKGSSQPLIDTGQMRQSVDYVIRECEK